MLITQTEAQRGILNEWREWPKEHGGNSTHDMPKFYFTWLPQNRPDLLRFRFKHDKWQLVKGWIQYEQDQQKRCRES